MEDDASNSLRNFGKIFEVVRYAFDIILENARCLEQAPCLPFQVVYSSCLTTGENNY